MNKTPIGNIDYSTYNYHPLSEKLIDILQVKTQSNERSFFRINTAYFFAKLAATMRTNIQTHDRGKLPVNVYAINLAPSGANKGYSKNIMEEFIITPFKQIFMDETFQVISKNSLRALAKKRVIGPDDDEDAEYDRVVTEFESCGPMLFSYDSATTPAVRQMRQKLLMAGSGSMSLEIDEIGSNLLGAGDVITTYLELYDVGSISEKLIKHTSESKRLRQIDGKTPANLLAYGTPNTIFDDPKIEEELMNMFTNGYGRRCIFGYSKWADHTNEQDPEKLYDLLTSSSVNDDLSKIADDIIELADVAHFNKNLEMDKKTHIFLLSYQIDCKFRASQFGKYQDKLETEMIHRYYKALKLAGTYAFIDQSDVVTIDHLKNAIRLVEDSGEAYANIVTREQPYERLANYIAEIGKEVTQVDLMENLPFFKGSSQVKQTMLSLATAFGYKNNIIIKKSYIDDIEFFKGETLEETDLEKLRLSYSEDSTVEYQAVDAPFLQLDQLITEDQMYFTTHHFIDEYRSNTKVVPGFNMIVLDIDGEASIATAQNLLSEFTYKMYTTKRHTDAENRFRIILPISHLIKLGTREYSQFMENVYEWLPFFCDDQTKDIARKWATNKDAVIYDNEGVVLDATLFIPQTKKSEQVKSSITANTNMSNLENWFLRETKNGNRSNMLLKYGLILKDAGYDIATIRDRIDAFNSKLSKPMKDDEISRTIMITIAKRMGH